jgi:hemin uptake protein HemP
MQQKRLAVNSKETGNGTDNALHRLAADIQLPGLRGRVVRSRDLLGDEGSMLIDHNGKLYLLRSLRGGGLRLQALSAD